MDPREAVYVVSSAPEAKAESWAKNARNQVGLELVEVNVKGAVEAERRSDAGDDLSDDPVEVLESRRSDTEVLAANVVDRCEGPSVNKSVNRTIESQDEPSLSTMKAQSTCSSVVWVVRIEL